MLLLGHGHTFTLKFKVKKANVGKVEQVKDWVC